jgi:hypothetical protein
MVVTCALDGCFYRTTKVTRRADGEALEGGWWFTSRGPFPSGMESGMDTSAAACGMIMARSTWFV